MILQSLAGLPAFLLYFCTAIVAVVAYLFVYTRVTPHDEFQLIRDNDPAAAQCIRHRTLNSHSERLSHLHLEHPEKHRPRRHELSLLIALFMTAMNSKPGLAPGFLLCVDHD